MINLNVLIVLSCLRWSMTITELQQRSSIQMRHATYAHHETGQNGLIRTMGTDFLAGPDVIGQEVMFLN